MKLVTWNINSVRLRLPLLLQLMDEYSPDVICLQETKCQDIHFPREEIEAAGYTHIHIKGMKSYNGLAVLSKIPFEETDIYERVGRDDCRHISVKIKGVYLHNIYIPAGGDEPDVTINEKFAHKLDFVGELTSWFPNTYNESKDKVIAVGDFNIAPLEHDVWSHKQLLKVVSHTPIEVEKLNAMKDAFSWVDVSREFIPENEKCYSWWSYRNRDWKKSNRGRRLDHIWVSEQLKNGLKDHEILSGMRDQVKPSDHAPIIVEIAL